MTVSISSPISGSAQTGFTSPTYTLTTDTPPSQNGKQWAVTALGGTQAGVLTHSVSNPFTLSFFKPAFPRSLPPANPITGIIKNISNNVYKFLTRKGVLPAASQVSVPASISTELKIPAGSDSYDSANLKAMISAHIGSLQQFSAGLGDTVITNIM